MPTAAGNSARHARVAAIGAAGAVWRVEAEVEVCVAVGAHLAGDASHLQAAGAGVAVGRLALIAWLLHTQEPSAPVEQDHPHLSTVREEEHCELNQKHWTLSLFHCSLFVPLLDDIFFPFIICPEK